MPQAVPPAYLGEEESPQGTVAYLYAFRYLADNVAFFLTNHTTNVSVVNLPANIGPSPQIFTSAQVMHSARQAGQDMESHSFDVALRVYADRLAASFHTAQAGQIRVHVIRVAQGLLADASPSIDFAQDCLIVQSGLVTAATLTGQQVNAKVMPEHLLLDRHVPRYWFQGTCNHQLYHSKTCKVVAASHNYSSTITALDRASRRLTISGQRAASAADYFSAGYLTHAASSGIYGIEVSEHVSTNTRLTLRTWSPEFVIGQAVVVFAGCNRTTTHCKDKFNNLANFGGMAFIPKKDPFIHGV